MTINRSCVGSLHTSAFTAFFLSADCDPQPEGFTTHELRPCMLLPAVTLTLNTECFQGQHWKPLQCLAVLGKTGRFDYEMQVPGPADSIKLPANGTS